MAEPLFSTINNWAERPTSTGACLPWYRAGPRSSFRQLWRANSADAALDYVTMSLNLNERDQVVNVRMRTKVHTIAADQPGAPTKALFRRALYVLQPHGVSAKMGPACMAQAGMHMGAGCAELSKVNMSGEVSTNKPGDGLMNHWIVPPGHHTYTTEITPQLNLPFDTTIHYATMHVHPFARGMELRDLTTGTTIFRLNSQDWPDRVGVPTSKSSSRSKGFRFNAIIATSFRQSTITLWIAKRMRWRSFTFIFWKRI